MDPFVTIPLFIFAVSFTAFWNNANMIKKEVVTSEKRFIVDQSVYQCEQRQSLTTRMPQDYGYQEPKIIYVDRFIEKKPPVKKRPVKPKVECKEVTK